MNTAPKINPKPVIEEPQEKQAARDETTALFLHGMERIAEIQKQWIDLAVQQNTEMVDMIKKAVEKVPGMPRLFLLEAASGAVNRYADTQKAAIDYVVEESHVWADTFKDRTSTFKKSTEATTNVAKQTLERSFAVQKKALDHTAAQTKAVVDAARQQFGWKGPQADAMTDTFQRSVDTIVDAQKELMEMVTH